MADIYDQVPLKSHDSIRLLKLLPASSTADRVKFELLEATLDRCPVFKAVSYSWDGQKPTEEAFCSGTPIRVTPNCNNVLQHLAANSGAPSLIWIDAICINQSPEAVIERNQQVSIMGDIYTAAEEVVVWLGSKIEPAWEKTFLDLSNFADANLSSGDENYLEKILELASKIDTKTLNDIFWGITWFSRVWVVQEVSLSRKATFLYGRVTLKYFHLIKSWSDLYSTQKGISLVQNLNQTLYNGFGTHIVSLRGPRRALAITEGYDTIEELFRQASRLLATEPRDKVYGLRGLLVSYGIPLPDADYRKSIDSIFLETTKAIMTFNRRLNVESCHYTSDTWPSWVPNWANSLPPITPKGDYHANKGSSASFNFVDLPNGSIGVRTTATIIGSVSSSLGTCLLGRYRTPEALKTDTVLTGIEQQIAPEWTSKRLAANDDISKYLAVYNIRILRLALSYMERESSGYDTWREDLYQIVINQASMDEKLDMRRPFTKWLDILSDLPHKRLQNPGVLADINDTPEMEVYNRISASDTISELHELFTAATYFWTFFKTDSGAFGAGAYGITSGDKVALIAGTCMPAIVRHVRGDNYRIIAPAFVCGIMQGEAWPKEKERLGSIVII
ncbi:heterokaryon incompatibility protein-domain-containing protein [Annulohypoxylon maeteangense]|uniref:heterokaryon incompatibility protein-domain-containing protein n=1 Tax=Annulohypoxylon maeteangense TaxID=1927788 RepID=UPI0020084F4B|nr:heterokaryon incompatibility protein-domain-containing protein [Annulohypoxylon maeteangense]KAI0884752.1 heterokaryon incompatibility protein-domain-containing protein [Annulohypoxylon maeteangense]